MPSVEIDKQWQAESDAHTLVEADIIKKDPERLAAAKEMVSKLVEEQERRLKSFKAVER